jgi:hypothetical protein
MKKGLLTIYFLKNEGTICGAQAVYEGSDDDKEIGYGNGYWKMELTTNAENEGLWQDGTQVIGHCDFSLNCSSATAKKRLCDYIYSQVDSFNGYEVKTSRIPLF